MSIMCFRISNQPKTSKTLYPVSHLHFSGEQEISETAYEPVIYTLIIC